jgi:hypothetical protein
MKLEGNLGTGTPITSRWPPAGANLSEPNLQAVDVKHLDVGEMSDVSDVSLFSLQLNSISLA